MSLIAVGAAKCRFCDAVFDPTLRRQEEKKRKKKSYSESDSDLSAGEWVFGIICSGIACIMGVIWLIQGKPKGGKMIAVALIADFVKLGIRLAIEHAGQ